MNQPNDTRSGDRATRDSSTVQPGSGQVQGEGDYEAAERYEESVRSFVDSGKVAQAARNAAPASREEAEELEKAEQAGVSRSRGEDPASPRAPDRKQ